jgi:hemerythrin-like domain-containing protein
MATMSMNRVIHGAIRRDLRRFIIALDTFRDGDHARAAQLATAWNNFDDQVTRHHEGEHEIAWPALEAVGVTRTLIATMDDEHERLSQALASAGAAMATLARTASAADAAAAKGAMTRLQTVAVEHLDHEEAEIEPIYLSKHDDPAIKAMGRRFGRISPPVAGIFFAWVTDGATPEELSGVKENVPGPVRAVIGGLFGRKYRREVAPVWR